MNNQPGVTHCVMRRGASWFAIPAEKVREVHFRPPLLVVPHSDALLAGLCHVRSEFLPVLRLDALLVDDPASLAPERQMLVLHGEEGPWGVLVDQVTALASLETSAAPEEDFHENWSEVVSGWAAHETQVVRVLDPQRFYSLAENLLCESWVNSSALAGTTENTPDGAAASPQIEEANSGDGEDAKVNPSQADADATVQAPEDPAAADVPRRSGEPSPSDQTESSPATPPDQEEPGRGSAGSSPAQSQPQT